SFFNDATRTFYESTYDTTVIVGLEEYISSVTRYYYEKDEDPSPDNLSIDTAFDKGLDPLDFNVTVYFDSVISG
ncbi:MAG: hypothetical protein ABID54_14160, partial [Pseudomonadota bacterium]